MTSIQDALVSVSLEKYAEAFSASGFLSLEDLTLLGPADLDKVLAEVGMLKGHTFKLKKMIEDAKLGNAPKPKPPMPITMLPPKPKPEFTMPGNGVQTKIDMPRVPEGLMARENGDKTTTIKTQLANILQSKEALVNSLKNFMELDLEPYFQALNQLKTMQHTARELLQTDVEMIN